jgi:hypothetical protein
MLRNAVGQVPAFQMTTNSLQSSATALTGVMNNMAAITPMAVSCSLVHPLTPHLILMVLPPSFERLIGRRRVLSLGPGETWWIPSSGTTLEQMFLHLFIGFADKNTIVKTNVQGAATFGKHRMQGLAIYALQMF